MMRLPQVAGEWIDRSVTVRFEFEGETVQGYRGDTIASALWASGRRVLGRSFKYHRPRGILSAANHDCNVMVQDGSRPNVRADVTAVREGMQLRAINTFGGVRRDRARLLGLLSSFLPVGFYYKAFHTKRLFPMWERLFRGITGLGAVDVSSPRLRTPKRYDFCDVLVIGAGPSGLSAALAAARAGAAVVVVDENACPGGSGLYQLGGDDERGVQTRELIARVRAHAQIRLYCGTVAAGYYADHWVALVDADRLVKMRARAVVFASGAFEQPAVFRNNDLPGVMLASAAQRLIHRYAVRPMRRAVVLTANTDGYVAALDLLAHGSEVAALVDLRRAAPRNDAFEQIVARGIPVHQASAILQAHPGADGATVEAVDICSIDAAGQPARQHRTRVACDGVLMSVGWAPAANLLYQAGSRMRFDETVGQFVPDSLPAGVFAAGRLNGVYSLEQKLLDGECAGACAAAHCGFGEPVAVAALQDGECRSHAWPIVAHPEGANFVDFDEDLQLKDFENAVQEGFDNIELLKRYSTNGMGPSQGKHSNMNGLRILARLTGRSPQQVGTTTARPFFHPVPMSHLAGRGFTPERRTPLHSRHEKCGARWMQAGVWHRPEYYERAGKSRFQCIQDEVAAVRQGVGIIDVGTLGKLDVRGPQAAEFLERAYGGRYSGMKVLGSGYGLMCDETGVIVDEGMIARLADDHFYFTTTTSGAANVYRELSRLNAMWRLDCGLVNLTGAMAAVNLAGPAARAVLRGLIDMDLSHAAFPYLAMRLGHIAGMPVRLIRVGFVGEVGYEIHLPAEFGPKLWDLLLEAGRPYGIRPFGVEAQRVLRLEKGHLIVGQDTDGLTTPFDVGMEWAFKMNKPFFVGQRSLKAVVALPRKQKLVGFTLPEGFGGEAPKECHLVVDAHGIAGRVTSIAFSAAVGRHIGFAYVKPEAAKEGTTFSIRLSDGRLVTACVAATPFYDPKNLRQQLDDEPQDGRKVA